MPRLIRKTAILAKVETTYGVDSVPTGAANAILISNAQFSIEYSNVERDNIRPFLGANEELAGTRFATASFEVEWANSGTAGTAPAWGPLLRACGFAEATLATPARIEYSPISATFTSLTIYYHLDGALRKLLGCMGTVEFRLGEGERPIMAFNFTGLDGGTTATADPTVSLAAFKTPSVITDQNSGDVKLGSTYSAGTVTGGTTYPSRGISIDVGNNVGRIALLGGQRVSITQRQMTGQVQLDLSAADEVSFRTAINNNELTSLSFEHGTGAGVGMLLHAPAVQRTNPSDVEFEGEAQMQMNLRITPTTAGNDELRLVLL